MDTELYVNKHVIMRGFLKDISDIAEATIDRAAAMRISELINKLTGVLNMHLASEDSFVYPKLLEHPDNTIRTITRAYMDEMRSIAAAYTEFHTKYKTPSKLLADVEGFKASFKTIRDALILRMDREEKELYTFIS